MTDAIRFYCTVNDATWNGFPVQPGKYVCVSPVYGEKEIRDSSISLPADCEVVQDSGAFCDRRHGRNEYAYALQRQITHAERYGYSDQIVARATYDMLVTKFDTPEYATTGVNETIKAARWLHRHRDDMPQACPLIITAQGLDVSQYVQCVRALLPCFEEGDILGLGGWAWIGKAPRLLMPVFRQTMKQVIPLAAQAGIKRVHIWGVCKPSALSVLLWECDQHGIAVQTDSSGPVRKVAFSDWGYAEWRDNDYKRPDDPEAFYHDRVRHVAQTARWLSGFRSTPNYPPRLIQTSLF